MMRGQKITPLVAALAQADRLSLLLHTASNRRTGATKEEVEAVDALSSVLVAVLKKVAPIPDGEGVRQARAAAQAAMGFLEQEDAEFAMRWMRFTKKLLTEALGEPWESEAEAWLRRQLDALGDGE